MALQTNDLPISAWVWRRFVCFWHSLDVDHFIAWSGNLPLLDWRQLTLDMDGQMVVAAFIVEAECPPRCTVSCIGDSDQLFERIQVHVLGVSLGVLDTRHVAIHDIGHALDPLRGMIVTWWWAGSGAFDGLFLRQD